MMRWALATFGRLLPAGISLALVTFVFGVFYLQNHTTVSHQGEFLLITENELAVRYKTYHGGYDHPDAERRAFIGPIFSVPVAKKTVMTRRAGLRFFERGHDASFEAEMPEFLVDSPFLRQLSRQLCQEYRKSAVEFTTINWSLVLNGFREPEHSLRNWSGMIGVDVVHLTPNAVSLVQSDWEFTGGLHGNGVKIGRCFVEEQGLVRQLKLTDLFEPTSDWAKRLVQYCVCDLRCQGASFISDASVADPESTMFTTEDLMQFTLSPAGMRFYFSPYHVGSYAEGVYTVRVPYSVIRDCLPDDSPTRLFMTKAGD